MHRQRQKILLQVLGPWHLGQPSSWDRRLPLTPPPPPPAWQGPPPCIRCHSPQAGSRRRGIRNSSPGGEAPGSLSAQLPESGPGGCRGLITNGSCLAATLGGQIRGSYRRQPLPGASRPVSKGHPPAATPPGDICCCHQRDPPRGSASPESVPKAGAAWGAVELSLFPPPSHGGLPPAPSLPLPEASRCASSCAPSLGCGRPGAGHKPSLAKVTAENQPRRPACPHRGRGRSR